jgi:hypothetical protein
MDNILLLRVKTPIPYSPIHLFTYSPIHLFLSSSHSSILGGQNQNGAVAITSTRIGRMLLIQVGGFEGGTPSSVVELPFQLD